MAYSGNKFSFTTPNPKSKLFNFVTPRNVKQGEFFSKTGQNFQFQDTDRMGLGPYIRLVPSIALAASVIVFFTLITTITNFSDQLNAIELSCCIVLTCMVVAMIGACAWLLRDFSESAIIDQKHKTLWLGGGYFGRWEAIDFDDIESINVIESDKTFTESHYQVQIQTIEQQYTVYKDSLQHLVNQCAEELSHKLGVTNSKIMHSQR